MAIQIETYSQDDFLQLRTDWEQLQTGKEMTYFQTWDWNNMLLRGVPKDSAHFETLFLLHLIISIDYLLIVFQIILPKDNCLL